MATKQEVQAPQPINPQDVENNFPPPSYEEVMGHQAQSSINKSVQQELPALAYTDIMPRCYSPGNIKGKVMPQFDKFSALIAGANQWLRSNPDVMVWKCETVERKCEEGPTIQMDKMIYHQSTFGFNVYVRGLRLWLTKNPNPNAPPQQIGMLHKVPEKVNIPIATRGVLMYNPAVMAIVDDPYFSRRTLSHYTTFEGFKDTIQRLNDDLKKNPLQGAILNVEAAMHKSCEGFGGGFDLDPDITVWAEDGKKMKRFTQIIRVFYIIGPPAHEEIGLHQFEPEVSRAADISRPTLFNPMSSLMQRVAMWLPNQTGLRVVNIQTHDVRYTDSFGMFRVMSDSTDDYESQSIQRKFLTVIRVFYVTSSVNRAPQPPGTLSWRTFIPVRTQRKQYESMSQTMHRIEAWLKVTGIPIYSVETTQYLFKDNAHTGVDTEKTSYCLYPNSGQHYVTAVRVYFPYPYQEPHPNYLPYAFHWSPEFGNAQSGSCDIL